MKKIILSALMAACTCGLSAQSTDQNYVMTKTHKQAGDPAPNMDITYYDGLGYPIQTILVGASTKGAYRNIVTPIAYDNMRRGDAKTYLPYASTNSSANLEAGALSTQSQYYSGKYNDGYSYMEKRYGNSPLNRVQSQVNVGSAFRSGQEKKAVFEYLANGSSEILKFSGTSSALTNTGYYASGKLFKTVATNEDGAKVETFKDSQDRTVLERTYDGGTPVDTYYVYDDFDRLVWVISPKGSELVKNLSSISADHDVAKKYCYIYTYDGRGRMTERKLPGKEIEYLVYDKGDRVVLSQDGNLRANGNNWIYNVYDNLGRSLAGNIVKCNNQMSRKDIQNQYDNISFNNTYPTLGGSPDTSKPFACNEFTFVSNISETRYGEYHYMGHTIPTIEDPLPAAPAGSQGITTLLSCPLNYIDLDLGCYMRVDLNQPYDTGWGSIPGFIDAQGMVDSSFFIGVVSYDPYVWYYFFPAGLGQYFDLYQPGSNQRYSKVIELRPSQSTTLFTFKAQYDRFFPDSLPLTYRPSGWKDRHITQVAGMSSLPGKTLDSWPFGMPRRPHGATPMLDIPLCHDKIFVTPYREEINESAQYAAILHYLMPLYFDEQGQVLDQYIFEDHAYHIPEMYRPQLEWLVEIFPQLFSMGKVLDRWNKGIAHKLYATIPNPDYDHQTWQGAPMDGNAVFKVPEKLAFADVEGVAYTYNNLDARNNGLKIYDKVAVLDGSGSNAGQNYIERAYYYDYMGRVIQTVEKNHLGGISRTSFKYDFVGNILTQHESHQKAAGTAADILIKNFSYDDRSRLLSETSTLNNGTPAVVTYAYDELGKLASKTYGTGASAVTETLKYNIQGWLTEQQNSLFGMKLRYYDPQKSATPSYTGNISEWEWQHPGQTANTYAFAYDKLARLTGSQLFEGTSSSPTNKFTEQGIFYDRNGNMSAMKRYGNNASTPEDNMAFTGYDGNKLVSMTNNGTSHGYQYDANGNMTSDGLSALKIEYNFLNLTGKVTDISDNVKATYRWLADGTKVGVKDVAGTLGYEYMGSLVYHYVNGELQLEGAAFGGGRIMVAQGSSGATYTPNYFIADHLGSTRVIYDPAASAGSQIVARYDYMPFGQVRNATGLASVNRYKFSGKEEQTTGDLKFFDFGARFYNSRIGRWNGIDPLAENHYDHNPFNYCANNPALYLDPNGMDWVKNMSTYQYEWRDDVTSRKNTPDGFAYVGAWDWDILSDMGLSELYWETSEWSPFLSFGSELPKLATRGRGGSLMEAVLFLLEGAIGMQSKGYVRFNAISGCDKDQITETNTLGKVFKGLSITGGMSQFEGSKVARNGNFDVSLADGTVYTVPMLPQNGPNTLKMPNTYNMGRTMYLPSTMLTSPIVGATIRAAVSDNTIILGGATSVKFNFRK